MLSDVIALVRTQLQFGTPAYSGAGDPAQVSVDRSSAVQSAPSIAPGLVVTILTGGATFTLTFNAVISSEIAIPLGGSYSGALPGGISGLTLNFGVGPFTEGDTWTITWIVVPPVELRAKFLPHESTAARITIVPTETQVEGPSKATNASPGRPPNKVLRYLWTRLVQCDVFIQQVSDDAAQDYGLTELLLQQFLQAAWTALSVENFQYLGEIAPETFEQQQSQNGTVITAKCRFKAPVQFQPRALSTAPVPLSLTGELSPIPVPA